MLKRVFINILLIIVAFIMIESYCFFQTKHENNVFKNQADKLEANNTRQFITKYKIMEDFNTQTFRPSYYIDNSKKKPILWFGCSFAEGAGLSDEITPAYKIAHLTGRSCINKAKGATGTQFMYYQLNNDEIMSDASDVDYIIYIFIWNHIQRLYNYQINPLIEMFNLRYKIQNNKLELIKPFFKPIYSSFFIKRLLNRKVNNQARVEQYKFELFNKIMEESLKKAKLRYPNSKFIMVEFPELSRRELPDYEVKKLQDMGIIFVKFTDFIDKDIDIYDSKYWLSDEIHPTSETWDLFLPGFTKQYIK